MPQHKAANVTSFQRDKCTVMMKLKDESHNLNVFKAFRGIRKICHKGKMDLGSKGIDFKVPCTDSPSKHRFTGLIPSSQ